MIVYAETSAVLRWLLNGPRGDDVRTTLASATRVFASRLTLVEARRALLRAYTIDAMRETQARALSATLARVARRWNVVELTKAICERAEQRFPAEPVRSLDALHLATTLYLGSELGEIALLSTDERIIRNGLALGFPVVPTPTP